MTDFQLKTKTRVLYGVSDLGVNILVIASIMITFTYLTMVLGVPPGFAGTLLLVAKLWDIITDPIIGRLSDRTQSRFGRRLPWMAVGAVLMSLGFAAMFLTPWQDASPQWQGVYFVASLILTYTAFSMVGVPYGAMTPELTSSYHERSSLTAWRMAFGGIGLLLGGAGAPAVIGIFGGGIEGHRMMGLVFIPLIALPTLITVWGLRQQPLHSRPPAAMSLAAQWRMVWQNKLFVRLALLYLIQAGMMAQVTAGLLLACAYLFESTNPNALLTLLYPVFVFSTLIAMPFWLRVARKQGKARTFVIGGILFSIGCSAMVFMNAQSVPAGIGLMVVIGLGYSTYMIFPWSMLADCISHSSEESDSALEGVLNGWWTALQKTGIALGPFIIGWMLQLNGFVSATDGSFPAQSDQALMALRLSISVVPAMIFALTLFGIHRWPLQEDTTEPSSVSETAAASSPNAR